MKPISNEELLAHIDNSIAKAMASVASANVAGVTANAGAGSAGAGAGTANARTQSNQEQAGASVKTVDATQMSNNVDSDINFNEMLQLNMKRTYDVHQTYDMETATRNRTHFDVMITEQQKHLSNLNHMTLQALANNQNQSNLNNTLGIDRAWNLNETDALSVLLNKVVGDAIARYEAAKVAS